MVWATMVTRVLVGGVILLAAGLKTYDLLATPGHEPAGSLRTTIPEFALVAAECLLAAWLLSGRGWPMARGLAIAWMIALCGVSLFKAGSGADSCGCFGRFQVNPWLTFVLDVAALGALLCSSAVANLGPGVLRQGAMFGSQIVLLGAMVLVFRSPLKGAAAPAGAPDLDPAKWVGQQPWSLGKYVEHWDEISHGQWVVILYSPDCHACTTTRDNYEILAGQWRAEKSPVRVALIDTVGQPDDYDANTPALYGLLATPDDWEIPTPALVLLVDGRVVAADQGFDECQWGDRKFPP